MGGVPVSHELTLWILFVLFAVAFVLCQVIFLRREREAEHPLILRGTTEQIESVRLIHPDEP